MKSNQSKIIQESPAIGGNFRLTNDKGKKVTESIFLGKNSLVFFGFTNCPDICPMTIQYLSDMIGQLPETKRKDTRIVFISIDPERDGVETLNSYLSIFGENIIGLTGSLSEIEKVASSYHVYLKRNKINDLDYTIDHSSFIFLIDKRGRYVDHFNKDISTQILIEKINKLT